MNIEVHKFLQDHNFTKSCARPPAIGEENEVTSVDGRMSTHSSVSGKSEVSTATPRRTDIDLGFEPEGSASPLPMCDRWRFALHNVLEDSEGIRLFKKFLSDSKQTELIDGWLACKGFKGFGTKSNCSNNSSAASSTTGTLTAQMDFATLQNRGKLARKIFNTYLKKDKCIAVSSIIKDITRKYIYKQIKDAFQPEKNMSSFELDATLFDQALNEIEMYIEKNCYVPFLNSELLRKYAAQSESKPTKPSPPVIAVQSQTENKNSSSNTSQVQIQPEVAVSSRYLPRLDENQVWHPPYSLKHENTSFDRDQSLRPSSLAKQAMKRSMAVSQSHYSNLADGPDQNHPAYAYLVAPSANKYYVPPASANASDNASSDATSDTLSITDGSMDFEPYNAKQHQKRMMRHQMKRNPHVYCPAEENFIPLTRRCHYKQNLATLATDYPKEFFSQLKEKLDKVVEERKRAEIIEAAGPENLEDILERHIETVGHMKTPNPLDSPNRNQSPPPMAVSANRGSAQTRHPPFPNAATSQSIADRNFRQPRKELFDHRALPHRPSSLDQTAALQRRPTDSLRRRREITEGMARNEVPDVMDVPAPPVDKNSFISEWIKQQDNVKSIQPQNSGPQLRRGSVAKPGKPSKFINPSDSFPTQAAVTSKASSYHSQPLQPISQDRMMPPLSHPDPRTMLDEVKRRLIEETEERCYVDSIRGMGGAGVPPQIPFAHMDSFSGTMVSSNVHSVDLSRHATQPGSSVHDLPSASSGKATVAGVGRSDGGKMTCIYYMNDEKMAYKMQIPHRPVTLGLFKTYLRRKGNFAYYFKQYSPDIGGPVYFQILVDDEVLPVWENAVVARVKIAGA